MASLRASVAASGVLSTAWILAETMISRHNVAILISYIAIFASLFAVVATFEGGAA